MCKHNRTRGEEKQTAVVDKAVWRSTVSSPRLSAHMFLTLQFGFMSPMGFAFSYSSSSLRLFSTPPSHKVTSAINLLIIVKRQPIKHKILLIESDYFNKNVGHFFLFATLLIRPFVCLVLLSKFCDQTTVCITTIIRKFVWRML